MRRAISIALVLAVAACSETPTAPVVTTKPQIGPVKSLSFVDYSAPSDVTYGVLHTSIRFYNTSIPYVSSGTISGTTATVDPGATITVQGNWAFGLVGDVSYCPRCIVEVYVAWIPDAAVKGATPLNAGLFKGRTSYGPYPGSGSFGFTTKAPTSPGIYYIGKGETWDYVFQPWAQGGFGAPTGNPSGGPAASFKIIVPDPTAPEVTPVVTGTLGDNGWYTSDVNVSWTVSDPESGIDSSTGCDAASVTSDTNGTTFTCSATSFGGTTTQSVTIKRDTDAPVVSYAGNAGSYDVADNVAITCSATDGMSGIASTTCADITGGAYGFALGTNTFSASATDNAGLSSSASTSFTVSVSYAGVCSVATSFSTNAGVANSLCAKLNAAAKAKNASTRNNILGAFTNEVSAQAGKKLTEDQAAVLMALANALMG